MRHHKRTLTVGDDSELLFIPRILDQYYIDAVTKERPKQEKKMKRLEKTPEGVFEVEYEEVSRKRMFDKDLFINWLCNEAFPEAERVGREVQGNFEIDGKRFLAETITKLIEDKGLLPKLTD